MTWMWKARYRQRRLHQGLLSLLKRHKAGKFLKDLLDISRRSTTACAHFLFFELKDFQILLSMLDPMYWLKDSPSALKPGSTAVPWIFQCPVSCCRCAMCDDVRRLFMSQAFNGLSGKVQSFDKQSGRYDVLLISSSGYQLAKIKGDKPGIDVVGLFSMMQVAKCCNMLQCYHTFYSLFARFFTCLPLPSRWESSYCSSTATSTTTWRLSAHAFDFTSPRALENVNATTDPMPLGEHTFSKLS